MIELSHKSLTVWKKSKKLVSIIYKLTQDFPKVEIYGLTSQMRRASISIISNLSEGAARKSSVEKSRFFEIARSSLVELDAQIEIAVELKFLKKSDLTELKNYSNEIFAMLTNLIKKYADK